MNVRMRRMAGIAATRLLAHSATGAPIDVLVVTTFELDEVVFDAPRARTAGFPVKSAELEASSPRAAGPMIVRGGDGLGGFG